MDIDLAALRTIERDKEISMDYLIKTLEDALLNAYQKTDNPLRGVKVEIDRKTGRVAVLAPEFDDEDNVIGFYDDTPADFGRVAAATARQVIRVELVALGEADVPGRTERVRVFCPRRYVNRVSPEGTAVL